MPQGHWLIRSGYKSSPFPLKASQQTAVTRILAESGFMPQELVAGEVDWFYNHLGIENSYFVSYPHAPIASFALQSLTITLRILSRMLLRLCAH